KRKSASRRPGRRLAVDLGRRWQTGQRDIGPLKPREQACALALGWGCGISAGPFGVTGLLTQLIALLASFIVAAISSLGLFGIALMMAIESACIPLPSEIIMPFAGYLVSIGQFNLPLVATAGAIGCNLGSAVAYAVGQ